jgi:hypothetical protein
MATTKIDVVLADIPELPPVEVDPDNDADRVIAVGALDQGERRVLGRALDSAGIDWDLIETEDGEWYHASLRD